MDVFICLHCCEHPLDASCSGKALNLISGGLASTPGSASCQLWDTG